MSLRPRYKPPRTLQEANDELKQFMNEIILGTPYYISTRIIDENGNHSNIINYWGIKGHKTKRIIFTDKSYNQNMIQGYVKFTIFDGIDTQEYRSNIIKPLMNDYWYINYKINGENIRIFNTDLKTEERFNKMKENIKLREEHIQSLINRKPRFSNAEKQELRRQEERQNRIDEEENKRLGEEKERIKKEEEKKREQEFYEERFNNSRRIQKNKRLELAEAILSGPNPECDFHKDFGDIVNVLKEKRRMEHYNIQETFNKANCLNCGISAAHIAPHISLYEMQDIQETMHRHVEQCCSKTIPHMQKRGWRYKSGLSTYDWTSIWRKECIDSLEEIKNK